MKFHHVSSIFINIFDQAPCIMYKWVCLFLLQCNTILIWILNQPSYYIINTNVLIICFFFFTENLSKSLSLRCTKSCTSRWTHRAIPSLNTTWTLHIHKVIVILALRGQGVRGRFSLPGSMGRKYSFQTSIITTDRYQCGFEYFGEG